MLVLSRKPGERIHVGDDIVITVTKVSASRVSVGIDAPQEIAVRRAELDSLELEQPTPANRPTAASSSSLANYLSVAGQRAK